MRTDVSTGFVLAAMLFCHVLDDYGLQAKILSSLKQRSWWETNAPDPLYRYDYLMALAMHALSWTFLVHLPLAWLYGFNPEWPFFALFIFNAACHAGIDHLKANMKKINLVTDQLLHVIQILLTYYALVMA